MAKRVSIIGSSSDAVVIPGFRDDEFQQIEKHFLEPGVITGFAVSQHSGGANMSVDVAPGVALIEITNTNIDSGETYKVYFTSDAIEIIPVTTADPTNPRKDRLILRIDVSVDPNGNSSNIAIIELLPGTPAGSPTAPAEPANAITLAIIDIPASDTTISTGQITDSRTFVTVSASVLVDLARESKVTAIHNNAPFSGDAAGSSNAYTLSVTSNITAYVAGQKFYFKANHENSGTATLNVNSLGAKTIKKVDGATNLASADIKNGQYVLVIYDGTNFQMLSPPGTAAGSTMYRKCVYLSGASSSTLSNPTSNTAFNTHTFPIPANTLDANTGYEITLIISVTHGTSGQFACGMRIGGTGIGEAEMGAKTSTNSLFMKGILMGTTTPSGSAAVRGAVFAGEGAQGNPGAGYVSVNKATNGDLTLDFFGVFLTSNGSNAATAVMCMIEKVSSVPFAS